MQIDEYKTGSYMRVGGRSYHQDLKIINGEVHDSWWRDQGHRLKETDIEDVLQAKPHTLVIGTGYAGRMQIPRQTLSAIDERDIRIIAEPTAKAVQTFNRLAESDLRVAGAFHLTC
ncbi:MAG: Mth938-like domain-containing protein [Desulfosarcinaceae bacterium]|jgi:hypothetical protein